MGEIFFEYIYPDIRIYQIRYWFINFLISIVIVFPILSYVQLKHTKIYLKLDISFDIAYSPGSGSFVRIFPSILLYDMGVSLDREENG